MDPTRRVGKGASTRADVGLPQHRPTDTRWLKKSLICQNELKRILRVYFGESPLAWQGAGTWLREARSIVGQKLMLDPT